MARGRMIDKVIILSKKINAVSEGAENLYYRLNVCADDFGRYHASPEIIKGQIYTRRKISINIIKKRLDELWNIGLIKLYDNDSEIYLEIVAFEKHQKLRSDIQPKAEYPEPKKFLQRSRNEPDTSCNETERDETERCSKLSLSKDKLSKEKVENNFDKLFEEFWKGYPKKIAKDYAKEKFIILAKQGLIPELIKATNGYMGFLKHRRVNDNFEQEPLNPATFLMKNRWRDYIDFKYKPRL